MEDTRHIDFVQLLCHNIDRVTIHHAKDPLTMILVKTSNNKLHYKALFVGIEQIPTKESGKL